MNAKAKLSDLIEALEFDMPDHDTHYDRETGRLVTLGMTCAPGDQPRQFVSGGLLWLRECPTNSVTHACGFAES